MKKVLWLWGGKKGGSPSQLLGVHARAAPRVYAYAWWLLRPGLFFRTCGNSKLQCPIICKRNKGSSIKDVHKFTFPYPSPCPCQEAQASELILTHCGASYINANLHTRSGWLIFWSGKQLHHGSQTYVGLSVPTHFIFCGTNRTRWITNLQLYLGRRKHLQNMLE